MSGLLNVKLLLALVAMVLLAVSAAYAATISGTDRHNWGKGHTTHCPSHPKCGFKLRGGGGPDRMYGRGGWDWIEGDNGKDKIFGGGEMDQIYGSGGNDRLIGGRGHDHLFGGEGNDYINSGPDTFRNHIQQIYGGPGRDTCVMVRHKNNRKLDCEKVIYR